MRFVKIIIIFLIFTFNASLAIAQQQSVLDLLHVTPSPQSVDYVNNQKQFQLHTLLTEQRHPKTWNLGYQLTNNTTAGLQSLFSVDEDITKKLQQIASDPKEMRILNQASKALETAILNNKKIYLYGCGATGRLAKLVESAFWRPFWINVQSTSQWQQLQDHLRGVENELIGEMTGADRALISSLEGFEDLQLIGKLQLMEHKIKKDDVVFAITEGGETSSVIGTILAAAQFYGNKPNSNLYFMYDNPDKLLMPFDRSRSVLNNPAINKINLTTGPMALAGSTRMQATTIQLFVMGALLEDATQHVLQKYLSPRDLETLGFDKDMTLKKRLLSFRVIQKNTYESANALSKMTDAETATYAAHHFSTYFADRAVVTVFTDSTERSPTFRLSPLDTINEATKKSWIQIWNPASNQQTAWLTFLKRPFHGLNYDFYQSHFANEIQDRYLQSSALNSLKRAGDDQQYLYDFSFSKTNIKKFGPKQGDLGVMVLLQNEYQTNPAFKQWLDLFTHNSAKVEIVLINANKKLISNLKQSYPNADIINTPISDWHDPFTLRQQISLKMLLNAHSTAVMAKLGLVVGNTMTNVNPGNLKLIGRATYLIESHVNDALLQKKLQKKSATYNSISYSEANSVLFNAMDYVQQNNKTMQVSEVALSIVRILESIKNDRAISWNDAINILQTETLQQYLKDY